MKWLKDEMELDVQAANGRINVSPNGTLHISGKEGEKATSMVEPYI
jgi:hypothetical protein